MFEQDGALYRRCMSIEKLFNIRQVNIYNRGRTYDRIQNQVPVCSSVLLYHTVYDL